MNKKKMSQILAAILALAMPFSYQAASFNHVDRVLTVLEGEILKGEEVPCLKLRLIDDLQENALFYIELTGGQWLEKAYSGTVTGGNATLVIQRINGNRLQVKIKGESLKAGAVLQIPMELEMMAEKAQVVIKGNNTVISSGTYLIAQTQSYKGKTYTGQVPVTTTGGMMAELYIEEPFSSAFKKAIAKEGCSQVVQVQLQHNGYAFHLADSKPILEGIQGFEELTVEDSAIRQIDAQTLEITLPDTTTAHYLGAFKLSGIKIKSTDKVPSREQLKVTVVGDLVETHTLEVLKVMDYAIGLEGTSKEVRAGSLETLAFTLEEKIEDSLVRNRPTTFTLQEGVYFETTPADQIQVSINGETILCDTVRDARQNVIGFTVPKLKEGIKCYQFKVPVYIDLKQSGTITLKAEGRSLLNDLSLEVMQVIQPFTFEVQGFQTVVGVKNQTGGKVILKETSAGQLRQGEKIILKLEESPIKYSALPQITVTQGDVRLGQPVLKEGYYIEIPVIRRSNVPSTISLSEFQVTVDQTVALGNYQLTLSGEAFAKEAYGVTPILWQDTFIQVYEKNSGQNEPTPAQSKVMVLFTIGQPMYSVGEYHYVMEAAPYASNGRTMLPVKYVADAIGILPEAVRWDGKAKRVLIDAADTIELQLGSKIMKINGEAITMSQAPEAVNGRVFIPVAEITRALKIQTQWLAEKKQVTFETVRS